MIVASPGMGAGPHTGKPELLPAEEAAQLAGYSSFCLDREGLFGPKGWDSPNYSNPHLIKRKCQ